MADSTLDQIQAEFDRLVHQAQRYLTSEEGVRVRRRIAAVMIAAAPVVAVAARTRLPVVGRLVGTATLAAAVINFAGKIRDWDPRHDLQRTG